MYRTTNIGLAAWLVSCGHELTFTDRLTGQIAFYFKPTDEVSADIERYRHGDGVEEATARRCNEARIQLARVGRTANGAAATRTENLQ